VCNPGTEPCPRTFKICNAASALSHSDGDRPR
jgi:hypothetical protein